MDSQIKLLCSYGGEVLVTTVMENTSYDDLVSFVSKSWPSINEDLFTLTYRLRGYNDCLIEDDEDVKKLVVMCKQMNIIRVDVHVTVMQLDNDLTDSDEELHDCGSGSLQVVDNFVCEPSFYTHREQILMASGWSSCIQDIGQKFEGGAVEFRKAICKFSIEVGFQFRFVKNDKQRVTAVCKYRDEKGCKWRIHASREYVNGFFYIRTFEKLHTCGAVVRMSKHPRVTSKLVGDLIEDKIRSDPLFQPIKVIGEIKDRYGLDINYHHAWYGVENARRGIYGDHSHSFDQLRWYFDQTLRVNPGSHMVLDVDQNTRRFKRCFISFAACINGFNYIRPLIFLDGTFLKGRHKGVVLGACGKTCDQEVFNIAFAVVGSEDKENWMWFLNELRSILDPFRKITFISDRHTGIIEGIKEVFPNDFHGFCLFHLKFNLLDKLRGLKSGFRNRLVYMMSQCAYAPDFDTYQQKLQLLLKEGGQRVSDFLSNIPVENWCNAFLKGQRYGEMSSSLAESWNKMINEARHMPITSMIDSIRVKSMKEMAKMKLKCQKWDGLLCPEIQDRLQDALDIGRTWRVSSASEYLYEVHCEPSMLVNIGQQMCYCGNWQHHGFPSEHAVTILNCSSAQIGKDLYDFIEPYFYKRNYELSVSEPIHPIVTFGKPLFDPNYIGIMPPITKKQPGRPKKKRIPSRGEFVRAVRCGRCGKKGRHNRKSCREVICN